MPHSVWRRVRARVHLSLTPVELSNPVRSATKKAFSSLLMRYNPDLGGAVVAHIGPVELCSPPVFVEASPFAHVAATATLLVFAPPKGIELLGVVTHVGPDHLGLSVLSAFHAVLPIEGLADIYRFESKYRNSTPIPTWKRNDGTDHITVDRQIRFVVSELKPTRTGLFQIIASLNSTLSQSPHQSHPLGLLSPEHELTLSSQSLQNDAENTEEQHADDLQVTRRTSFGRIHDGLTGDELLTADNDALGDALMPTVTPASALKEKKRRRTSKEPRSVTFQDPTGETPTAKRQDPQPLPSGEQRLSGTTPSANLKGNEASNVDGNRIEALEVSRKGDRKKRNKKKSDGKDQSLLLVQKPKERATAGVGMQAAEQPTCESGQEVWHTPPSTPTATANGKDCTDEKKSEGRHSALKREKKKKKKKRREKASPIANEGSTQSMAEVRTGGSESSERKKRQKRSKTKEKGAPERRTEDTGDGGEEVAKNKQADEVGRAGSEGIAQQTVQVKTEVNRASSMRIDAEKAVLLGPMGTEERESGKGEGDVDIEGEEGLVQTQAQGLDDNMEEKKKKKKKKKKRRRRASEGEVESAELPAKKKRKRRMSEAIAIERRRSSGRDDV